MDNVLDVTCPFCGESSTIEAEPGGGREQEFVQDCPVCCRPWRVRIRFRRDGTADVDIDGSDG